MTSMSSVVTNMNPEEEQTSNTEPKTRCLSDINSILEFAKLEPSSFRPCIQCIYFSENLENESIKLLELEEPVLGALQEGQRVEIRGDPNDNAVLVTEERTYELREAETSNSMLMLQELKFGCDLPSEGDQHIVNRQVSSVVRNYFELRPIKPRLKKLRALLEENPYRGRECEGDDQDTGKRYTFSDLQEKVQASDLDIKAGLERLNTCEIDGYWRLLDFEYVATVLHHIIQLCEERDWLQEGVNVEECLQVLTDLFPRQVVIHCVFFHSTLDSISMDTDSNIVHLSEDKICKHYAELCLKHSGKFSLDEFLRAWQESVPEGMRTSLDQIQGMALIDRDAKPAVIWYYSVDDLPEDVQERFEELFEERNKWSLDEITPYIKDLTDAKKDVGAILTKYARASLQNGIKMFSSRKTS